MQATAERACTCTTDSNALLGWVLLVQQKPIWLLLRGHETMFFCLGFVLIAVLSRLVILNNNVRAWNNILLLGISLHFPPFCYSCCCIPQRAISCMFGFKWQTEVIKICGHRFKVSHGARLVFMLGSAEIGWTGRVRAMDRCARRDLVSREESRRG